jgi:hypothetical protein
VAPSISVIARPGPHPAARRAVATRPCAKGCGGSTVASGAGTPDLATGIQPVATSGVGDPRVDRIAKVKTFTSRTTRPKTSRSSRRTIAPATTTSTRAMGDRRRRRGRRVEAGWKLQGASAMRHRRARWLNDPVLITHARMGLTPTRTCACLVMKGSPVRFRASALGTRPQMGGLPTGGPAAQRGRGGREAAAEAPRRHPGVFWLSRHGCGQCHPIRSACSSCGR